MNYFDGKEVTINDIKELGKEKSEKNLDILIRLYKYENEVQKKREIVSSIGRQFISNEDKVYNFINENVFNKNYMDVIYQFYRSLLYHYDNKRFSELARKVEDYYDNEVMYKMKDYYFYKKRCQKKKKIKINNNLLLEGDANRTLKTLPNNSVHLIFTSPPYYNAKEYSNYTSYKNYLNEMKKVFIECHRILDEGRFIIINVSPVIVKRPGREFESIRYPIHFDFHNILQEVGYYFIDEIIWIKPEPSVPNRNGGYIQTRKPLSYKPNCITESLLVYRKNCNFLLDKNIKEYPNFIPDFNEKIDTSNCWYITPSSSKYHPAIFPQELCKKVLKYYSFENDVVLDPFAGIGSLGIAAKSMNRIFILCEKNEKYINYIKEHI